MPTSSRLTRRGAPWLRCGALAFTALVGCASDDVATPTRCPDPLVTAPAPAAKAARPPIDAAPLTTERRRTIALKGFGEGGVVALDVQDDLVGPAYQIYDMSRQQVVQSYPYTSFTAVQQWKKIARTHKIAAFNAASQQRPGGDLMLLGADSPGWVVIYLMQGERAVPYFRVPRLVDEEGHAADVRVPRLAWSPDGRWALVIHTQALRAPRPWESDFVHAFALDAERLPFE